jgi:hypothetical protein
VFVCVCVWNGRDSLAPRLLGRDGVPEAGGVAFVDRLETA